MSIHPAQDYRLMMRALGGTAATVAERCFFATREHEIRLYLVFLRFRWGQMMAPLREKLAEESVFEAGKLIDGKALLKAVVATANGFARRLVKHSSEREVLRAKCQAESDAVWSASYSQRVVLENLEWAADAVERAIGMTDLEAREAELDEAENLLQRPASSDSSFLCAAAHLYLALLWRMRENDVKVALHLLEVFVESPGGGRNELGPLLWEQLFQARFSVLEAWYHKQVASLLNQNQEIKNHDTSLRPHSFEALYTDIKGFWHQLPPSSSRSGPLGRLFFEREERLEVLGKLYQEALDDNTRRLAEFYKEALSSRIRMKRLHLPVVKLPQVQIQIVQRQLLSRNSLGSQYSSKSQLSRSSTMKENVCPEESSSRSRKTPKWLRKKTRNCSLLDGTELDELKLLSTWKHEQSIESAKHVDGSCTPAHELEMENPGKFHASRRQYVDGDEVSVEKRVISSSPRLDTGYSSFQKLPPASALKKAVPEAKQPKDGIPSPEFSVRSKCQTSLDLSSSKHVADLKQAVATLCITDDFRQWEPAVTAMTRIWMKSKGSPRVEAFLTKTTVIDVLMDILSVSESEEVQRAAVCLLTDLLHRNEHVKLAIKSYDPGLRWFGSVLHIPQAVVLLYLLKLHPRQVAELHIIPTLVNILRRGGADKFSRCILRAPKAAATFLLEQLVTSFDPPTNLENAQQLLLEGAVPCLVACLDSETLEEQKSAMVTLSCCRKAELRSSTLNYDG